jgi:inosose dehydratase
MDDSNVAIRLKGQPPMKLGYHSITWGQGVVGDPSGVTSIKDLYYRSPGSMEQAITDIAAAGYAGTEMFDGNLADFAATPEVLTESLYNSGLELISVYTGANFIYSDVLPDELYRINRAAELAVMFGARRLVVGGGARRAAGTTNEDYTLLGAGLDRVVDIAEQHGLAASYHPHLGTIAESPDEIERVFTSSRIAFCPDTAHLAAGGGDPAALIRAHSDRIAHVHLKDLTTAPFAFQPLGQGDLDFDEILSAVREVGYDDWLVVELDTYDGDPKTAAEISKKFLETRLGWESRLRPPLTTMVGH